MHAQFLTLPPERQVRVLLAAEASEPPDLTFCEPLGRSKDILPVLLEAVADEKDDGAKRSLIRALGCVHAATSLCDPRMSDIALTVARSIMEKEPRDEAAHEARAMRCTP